MSKIIETLEKCVNEEESVSNTIKRIIFKTVRILSKVTAGWFLRFLSYTREFDISPGGAPGKLIIVT